MAIDLACGVTINYQSIKDDSANLFADVDTGKKFINTFKRVIFKNDVTLYDLKAIMMLLRIYYFK